MNIYVLRHGQTNYNLEGRFQGQVDVEINNTGIEQIRETAKELQNIHFDVIISSPLIRAIQTAKILSQDEIIIDNRIIERSFGKLEGEMSIANYEEKIEEYNIETIDSLIKRTYAFLDDIINTYKEKENILIVTHECIAKVIESYFKGKIYDEDIIRYRLLNGKYKKYKVG